MTRSKLSVNPTQAIDEVIVLSALTSSELVLRICQGDEDALKHLLVDRCGGNIQATERAFRYDHDGGNLRQDICVQLFLDDWRRLKSWTGEGSLESWIGSVARQICLTKYRDNTKQHERFQRLSDQEYEVVCDRNWAAMCDLEREELRSKMLRALEKLNVARDKEIILLHCLGDPPLTADEMAAELGMSPGAFRTAKSRALDKFGEILEKEGIDHA